MLAISLFDKFQRTAKAATTPISDGSFSPRNRKASYLLQPSALGAHEGQRVVLVDVGNDGGHFVIGLREQWNSAHHLGNPQRGVHIQSAEVVVDGQELERKGTETGTEGIRQTRYL